MNITVFLDKLLRSTRKHQCNVYAYVLMTNHVHFLVTPHKEGDISKTIQRGNLSFNSIRSTYWANAHKYLLAEPVFIVIDT